MKGSRSLGKGRGPNVGISNVKMIYDMNVQMTKKVLRMRLYEEEEVRGNG